jgi:hypothetical protein
VISVQLTAGGKSISELGPGEELDAVSGKRTVVLSVGRFLGANGYGGRLPGVTRPGQRVTVALKRTAQDSSPLRASVALPRAIAVAAPPAGTTVSRTAPLPITVNPGPGTVRVGWDGGCVVPSSMDFPEGTKVLVPAQAIVGQNSTVVGSSSGHRVSGRCVVTLTISRVVTGTIDKGFGGGSIVALRSTTLAITSTR